MTWLRAVGACTAVVLITYAGFAFCAALSRSKLRADELVTGRFQPEAGTGFASTVLAALFPFDGDFLADHAIAKTAQVLNQPALDASTRAEDNRAAQGAVVAALNVSPIRPVLWLTLATLKARTNGTALPALKASYLTGPVSSDVAFMRLQAVTSSSAASDEEIRLLALSDIRAVLSNRPRFEAALIAAYVQATQSGKTLLMESAQALDPKFSGLLRRY
ncbi:hypothetical protein [Bradyrhizobium sp. Ai1a-2]|uniref:hypothetical protein n=1 Tax=Bradyrhizobium sp. Ai1a-2 TaxID=196490 RepID=UPI001FCA65BE|nr:hypothetical protein [Bradyrhizobium sp. Ai1a-2]